MNNNIQLHKGDIPENLNLGNRIAVDGEFMGLNVRRDPLCLIQLSSGNSEAHIIQFDRNEYNAPNLVRILRDEKIIMPRGDTKIKEGDYVTIFSTPEKIHEVEQLFRVSASYY